MHLGHDRPLWPVLKVFPGSREACDGGGQKGRGDTKGVTALEGSVFFLHNADGKVRREGSTGRLLLSRGGFVYNCTVQYTACGLAGKQAGDKVAVMPVFHHHQTWTLGLFSMLLSTFHYFASTGPATPPTTSELPSIEALSRPLFPASWPHMSLTLRWEVGREGEEGRERARIL